MADVNLYPIEPKKVIGEYTEFFAGQLPTANDFNRWLAVLIAQGDYNTAWLDLIAETAGVSINELYEELSILSEIVTPGSGTLFSQRLATLETNADGWRMYNALSDVDPSLSSVSTLNQIIPLMALKSKLILKNGQANYTGLGYAAEVTYVEITKLSLDRVMIKAYRNFSNVTNATAAEYFAVWDYATTSVKGFFKLSDNNDAGFVYASVTELGLVAATCTLSDIWNAMQNNSEIVLESGAVPTISIPTAPYHGTIHIAKLHASRQYKIEFLPKVVGAPYFMNLSDGNIPSGTWIQYSNNAEQLVTLPSTGWTAVTGGFQQTVTLTGAVATSNPDWCLIPAGQIPTATEKTNDSLVENATFGANTMTFLASAIPTINLEYRVKGV